MKRILLNQQHRQVAKERKKIFLGLIHSLVVVQCLYIVFLCPKCVFVSFVKLMQLETTWYMCGRTFEIALYPVLLSAHALQVSAKLVSCWARSFEYLSKLRYHSGFYHLNKYGSWTCICLPFEEFIFWTFIVFQRLVSACPLKNSSSEHSLYSKDLWHKWWQDGSAGGRMEKLQSKWRHLRR